MGLPQEVLSRLTVIAPGLGEYASRERPSIEARGLLEEYRLAALTRDSEPEDGFLRVFGAPKA
jgi:hypothetical protein